MLFLAQGSACVFCSATLPQHPELCIPAPQAPLRRSQGPTQAALPGAAPSATRRAHCTRSPSKKCSVSRMYSSATRRSTRGLPCAVCSAGSSRIRPRGGNATAAAAAAWPPREAAVRGSVPAGACCYVSLWLRMTWAAVLTVRSHAFLRDVHSLQPSGQNAPLLADSRAKKGTD